MDTNTKLKLLRDYYPDRDISPIETDKSNGIWYDMDGFEYLVLSNEEQHYISNNISGNISDNFEETEEHRELLVYSNN